jgi:hypothetical protein
VGGLVARYAIGRLYRPPKKENVADSTDGTNEDDIKATIGGLEPMNFITVATPHLGSRGNKQVSYFDCLVSFRLSNLISIHSKALKKQIIRLFKCFHNKKIWTKSVRRNSFACFRATI